MKKRTAFALSLAAATVFLLYVLASTLFFAPAGITVHTERFSVTEDMRLNLNTATSEELRSLSGIGESLSEAIVSWRSENGPFQKTEDLLLIPGIGEKTYEGIKNSITVGGTDEDSGRG